MKYIPIIIAFIFFLSCKKENTGDIILHENLPAFDEIEISSAFDIYLTQDSSYSLKIEGDKLFTESVNYTIEDNKLSLYSDSKKNWLHPESNKVKIYISSNRPKLIKVNETCFIRTINSIISDEFGIIMAGKLNMAELELNCNIFYYWNNHPCGGKITLSGQTQFLKIWNAAIMAVDAKNLVAQRALVENNSQGNCDVFVNDIFEYSISGSGNINLHKEPLQSTMLKEYSSTGRLLKAY